MENAAIIGAYKTTKSYFYSNSELFSTLENSKRETKIMSTTSEEGAEFVAETKNTTTDKNKNGTRETQEISAEFSNAKDNGTVFWNPSLGAVDGQGNNHSPALLLYHELVHAKNNLNNPTKALQDLNTPTAFEGTSVEELNAINETNEASKNLSKNFLTDDGGSSSRKDHSYKNFFISRFGAISTAIERTIPVVEKKSSRFIPILPFDNKKDATEVAPNSKKPK